MALEEIVSRLRLAFAETFSAVRAGETLPPLDLRRSARLPFLAALYSDLNRPVIFLTDRTDHALVQADELGLWLPDIPRLFFPEPTPLFYENAAWGETTRRDRLQVLTALATYHIPGGTVPELPPIIIAPARALMTRTLPRREFLKAARVLRQGQSISMGELVEWLVALNYEPVNTVISPGQFGRRGGILDVWPTADPSPVRLDFFGDQIDTLRRFDPFTQVTIKSIPGAPASPTPADKIWITPAREYLQRQLSVGSASDGEIYDPEASNEFFIPVYNPTPACLLDYLPRQALVVIDNLQAVQDLVLEIEEQAVNLRRDSVADGTLPAEFPIPYVTWSEITDSLSRYPGLELGMGIVDDLGDDERLNPVGGAFSSGPRFGGRLKQVMDFIDDHYSAGDNMFVVSRQSARLQELWSEQLLNQDEPGSQPIFIESSLGEGWVFSPQDGNSIILLTDGEIFGWRRPEPRRPHRVIAEPPEAPYSDLQPGDWVVHVDHGIGQLQGLVRRTVDGLEREYLSIEYADQAQLYVPIHQVDRLTRYVGPDNRTPTPSRLGGAEWKNVKHYVKEAVQEVAEDLLDLYARRNIVTGHAFGTDSAWQKELEASFPYIETEDQIQVLSDVKSDMESDRPMDRLICGDVGYGKTEVALRAAFKATLDGKQVAMLVPTTVLAQQHFNTFQQRLAAFPVTVEMLSRFRSHQQQQAIIQKLAAGGIDIIIGTHRLLSSDVQFKDLGLLIIDEEQRFGVTHKESLKKMRTEVDVLTLTATPIPRTLYMALSGVRDISTINTPPQERLPIITHVGPYSPRLVRQAILRELERGGQVFFVHNRVQTIGAMESHLNKLVPEARIGIAHGQMDEHELSIRMEEFTLGEIDILLSTSIIESGLDIPNANTLIVDRGDTFGLAQLYQLRGRVGRGAQRAYAYFFRHKRIPPTEEGFQRLETIAENTQLGAGFSIAMRDLEIRGTGDILGTRQHGHIAAVGFHLYTRLLAAAVRRLRSQNGQGGSRILEEFDSALISVNVELPLPVSIPADYIPDKTVRLGLYRRLSNIGSEAEIEALQEELTDRFGPLPEMVVNLLYQLRVKLLAERAGLYSITSENNQLVFRYPENEIPENLQGLLPEIRVGKTALWMPIGPLTDWRDRLLTVLNRLGETVHTVGTSAR